MSKYVVEINERSRKGKALKMYLENEKTVKMIPLKQTLNHLISTAPKDVPITDNEIMEEIYKSRKNKKDKKSYNEK